MNRLSLLVVLLAVAAVAYCQNGPYDGAYIEASQIDQREPFFWSTLTITISTTTTTTTTCTVSTSSTCSGKRRRRSVLLGEEDLVAPSPVDAFQASAAPSMEKRSAQYDGYIRAFPLQSTFAAPNPAAYGSFAGSPYHQPYGPYVNAYPQYGPFIRQQQPAAYPNALYAPEQRWLLTFSTSTSTKTSTSSSTPTCSTTSSFSACGSG